MSKWPLRTLLTKRFWDCWLVICLRNYPLPFCLSCKGRKWLSLPYRSLFLPAFPFYAVEKQTERLDNECIQSGSNIKTKEADIWMLGIEPLSAAKELPAQEIRGMRDQWALFLFEDRLLPHVIRNYQVIGLTQWLAHWAPECQPHGRKFRFKPQHKYNLVSPVGPCGHWLGAVVQCFLDSIELLSHSPTFTVMERRLSSSCSTLCAPPNRSHFPACHFSTVITGLDSCHHAANFRIHVECEHPSLRFLLWVLWPFHLARSLVPEFSRGPHYLPALWGLWGLNSSILSSDRWLLPFLFLSFCHLVSLKHPVPCALSPSSSSTLHSSILLGPREPLFQSLWPAVSFGHWGLSAITWLSITFRPIWLPNASNISG